MTAGGENVLPPCDANDPNNLFGRCDQKALYRVAVLRGEVGHAGVVRAVVACPNHRLRAQAELVVEVRPDERLVVSRL